MILVIDNYDSFVHNLARYLREAGAAVRVVRNDAVSAGDCVAMDPAGVVLSPGPKAPRQAGMCLDLIDVLPDKVPLLGVCLGHQCLVEAFGGATLRADDPLHGEATLIRHNAQGVFGSVPSPTPAGRYHSLIARPLAGSPLIETAWTEDGALMGVAHETRPWHGVQFHPESLLTPEGRRMMKNFLRICDKAGAT
jgi:anthranilate synthase component 2/para-aminobenzoate synthetase component 2